MLTVVLATAAGVLCDHRTARATVAARGALSLMLYALLPFVAYVSFAHLHLSLGAAVGLILAFAGLGLAGVLTTAIGRRMQLPKPTLGALICCVILVNTGYLGLPMAVVLLGPGALSHAVAYDQVISGPMLFTAGFAVGGAFGDGGSFGQVGALRAFLTRNPPLIAAIAGLIVPASLAPAPLVTASHVVVDGLLVLGFFAVGVYLSSERREDGAPLVELPDRRVALALSMRFLVNPVLLGAAILGGAAIPGAYLLQASMPSGINSLLIGHAFGLDQRLIATVIVWTTTIVLLGGLVAYLA